MCRPGVLFGSKLDHLLQNGIPMTIPADAAKRSRALDPAMSFHLEAPAGSGKTFLLTARFLRLLGLVAHPQQILALTFTNKAAGEMRERVRDYLNRARQGDAPRDDADAELLGFAATALEAHGKLEPLLLAGDILRIQTFHSFCYTMVSQAPLEAGLTPGSTLMDENEQPFFLHETVSEALQEIAGRNAEDQTLLALKNRLLYLNNSWWLLSGEMEDLMQHREGLSELVQVLGRDKASNYLAERIRELVETELRDVKTGFAACALGREWHEFLASVGDAGAAVACTLPADVPGNGWESLPEWLCLADTFLTRDGKVRKSYGPKTGFFNGFAKTQWAETIQEMPPAIAEKLHQVRCLPSLDSPVRDPDTLWDLVLLLNAVIDVYDSRCRSRRTLDFSALEMATLRLFDSAHPSDLQLIFDQQVRHILVDEFQDTSREQWALLQRLCAGWSDGDGRTLFLVGDPKQSIYGFRKAEVKLFMDASRGLPLEQGGTLALEPLVLDTNFRSRPHLIDWCNGLFGGTVMSEPRLEYDEVPFSPSVCGSPAAAERLAPPELALFLEWPDRESARSREAEWLAGKVARCVEENGRDSQTGILLFSRTHLSVYLEALQRHRLPVQVKEGLKLTDRPEVRYLRQLCRGIVLPHDDIAWASQLRSPWLFLDFDRILALSREEPELWVEKIRAFSEKDEETAAFWEALNTAWQRIGHEPLARVVETAWLDLGGARITAARWGSRGLNCCRRFLEMAEKAEQGEPVGTLAQLELLFEKSYEPVDPETASSNVFLSTVHGAKGLEFDSVFIPFLDWNPVTGKKTQPPPYMLERAPGTGDYLLAPRPDRLMGGEDPLYKMLRDLRKNRQLGEAKRLLYVAATRAKRELVMSAVVKKRGNGFAIAGDTPLGWLNRHYSLAEMTGLDQLEIPQEVACAEPAQWQTSAKSSDDSFGVLVEPPAFVAPAAGAGSARVENRPAEFEREKPRFKVISPSSLTGDHSEIAPATAALPCDPGTWGTLIHRLLAEYGKTGALPDIGRAGAYLKKEGVDPARAGEISRAALHEAEACLADPWLGNFYANPGSIRVEWPLESVRGKNSLYAGVIDLAGQESGTWKLVDFKTSRPADGESVDDFCRRESELYRAQVSAYREMWAALIGTDVSEIEAFLYWTALRRAGSILEDSKQTNK